MFNHIPDDFRIYSVIAVNEPVTQAYDARQVGNHFHKGFVLF